MPVITEFNYITSRVFYVFNFTIAIKKTELFMLWCSGLWRKLPPPYLWLKSLQIRRWRQNFPLKGRYQNLKHDNVNNNRHENLKYCNKIFISYSSLISIMRIGNLPVPTSAFLFLGLGMSDLLFVLQGRLILVFIYCLLFIDVLIMGLRIPLF